MIHNLTFAWWYGAVLIFLLGLCIGSFLNVCIYRIPLKISLRKPPSHCPACDTRLGLGDLVPVASYIALKGRCRHCGAPISPRYMVVELATGALYLLCYWRLPLLARLLPALALGSVLIASSFIDAEYSIIPNGLVLFGAAVGAAASALFGMPAWRDALLGAVLGGAPLFLIDVVSRMVLRKDGMGGGDVKLMAMAGLFLGSTLSLLALVLAVVAGGVVGAVLLLTRRIERGSYFPFGPFLAVGSFASLLFGRDILIWYFGLVQHLVNAMT